MRQLTEVREARELMTEAMQWGVWKWLAEKKRVRLAADKANDALDELENEIKAEWSDELKAAYNSLVEQASSDDNSGTRRTKSKTAEAIDPKMLAIARRVYEADEEAERVHWDAENTFEVAERKLSTSMAKDGARKAIDSWDLHEQAIRKAEAAARTKQG